MNGSDNKTPGILPVLTDVVADQEDAANDGTGNALQALTNSRTALDEDHLAELQTELASRSFALTDQLLHAAFQEMEASLFEQVSNRLRNELPDMIDQILREHIDVSPDKND